MRSLAKRSTLAPARTNPFDDFFTSDLSATFRSLMNDVFADRSKVFDVFDNSARYPKADARQTETGFEIDLAVPGCEKGEVDVLFEDGVLTVKHEKTEKNKSKEGEKVLFNELRHSSWRRAWQIPQEVKEEEISASLKNGILTVSVPLAQPQVEEKPQPRKIAITDAITDETSEDVEVTESKEE